MFVSVVQTDLEVFPAELSEDHRLDAIEIVQSILCGFLECLSQRLAGIVIYHCEQAPQRHGSAAGTANLRART